MSRTQECECDAITVSPEAPIHEIADKMDAHGVGCVVVVDGTGAPVGMVTDRDLLRRVIATGRDPEKARAGDVMTTDLRVGSRADTIEDLLDAMQRRSVRRIPLVEDGRLVGLLSFDDLVLELSSQLYNASEAVFVGLREQRRSSHARRRREAREDAVDELREQVLSLGDQGRERLADALEGIVQRVRGGGSR